MAKVSNYKVGLSYTLSLLKVPSRLIYKALNRVDIARYRIWLKRQKIDTEAQITEANQLTNRPLISIVVPTYNTPKDFFLEMVQSVKDQTYSNWELIICDDASPGADIKSMIKAAADSDNRIKYKFLESNHHIAGATNEAIRLTGGEFIALLDHDDILWPNALFEIAKALNNGDYDMIYSDEDKIVNSRNERYDPLFKPDWNEDFLRSVNYITHFTAIRKSVLEQIGFEDEKFNGAQDWELFLRVARSIRPDRIHHIPKIIYSWRVHESSTAKSLSAKPYVTKAQHSAIVSDLELRGLSNYNLEQDKQYPGQWKLSFVPKSHHSVSVLVSSRNIKLKTDSEHRKKNQYTDCEFVALGKNYTYGELLGKVKGKFMVLTSGHQKYSVNKYELEALLGDAERSDIGFVLTRFKNNHELNRHISGILEPTIAAFVKTMYERSLTKHLYMTTRHNIQSVDKGTVIIETEKLDRAIEDKNALFSLKDASILLSRQGYKNLYNPYVKW